MLIDGIHVPLAIPFTRDGEVAWSKLEANVRRYSLAPVSGLVALAPGFETGALNDEECVDVLRVVRRGTGDDKVLVAGVARESVRSALAMCESSARAEFDAVLLVAPALEDSERITFLRSVADACPLPVMLWDDALPLEALSELARHENVIGAYVPSLDLNWLAELRSATADVKREIAVTHVFAPATRRLQALAKVDEGLVSAASLSGGTAVVASPARPAVRLRAKTVGFQVMSAGSADALLELLQQGVAGAMPTLAACCPQAMFEVYAAFKDGDVPLAAEKALRIEQPGDVMCELGIAGIKYGCDVNGFAGSSPRLPKLPLTAEQRAQVERVLHDVPS